MAYDITKIKKDAMRARQNMERIGNAYAQLAKGSDAHATDIEALAKGVTDMSADLDALNQLKNSSDD